MVPGDAGLDAEDLWFIGCLAFDAVRRQLPAFKKHPHENGDVKPESRGFIVKFSGSSFERDISQFDLAKLDGEKGRFLPGYSFPGEDSATTDTTKHENNAQASDTVSTIVIAQYHMGCAVKELYYTAAFTRSALEGGECSCCVFHGRGKAPASICAINACSVHN